MGRSRSRSAGRYRSRSRGRRHRETRQRSPERRRRRSSVEEVKESPKKKPEDSNKPKVTESNGEISMSIEETNKLRISMGLKPLRLTKPESKEVNLAKSREEVENENQQKQLKDALEKSKKKRAYAAKLQGKSLGEMLQEESTSTLDWVRRNRTIQPKAVETTKKESQGNATYSSSDLKGLTVAHDAQSFEEGEEVILTLKDNQILTADLGDVNQEDDELENINLAEVDKRNEREEQAKRASGPVYTGYDDDEFTAHFSEDRPKKRLLTQYDEEDDMQEARARKKFALSELGSHAVEKPVARDVAPGTISLGSIKEFQTMDDYYTQEEMAVFNKKKAKKLRKKKGGKSRQREADEDTENLVEQLEAEATTTSNDHGKRQGDGTNAVAQLEAQNRDKFENARKKESEKARAALATTQDDIDEELSASLARSRQLALQAVAKNPIEVNDTSVFSLVTSEGGNIHRDESTENTIVFSETTDFDVRVKNAMEERSSRLNEEPQSNAPAK
ncbi:U4/U6.U5 tri-snRNP-associated protein, partial [Thraustotheca clavata]